MSRMTFATGLCRKGCRIADRMQNEQCEGTPARGLVAHRDLEICFHQIVTGNRQFIQIRGTFCLIDGVQTRSFEVGNDPADHRFRLSNNDGVGNIGKVSRVERREKPAHDHLDAASAEFSRQISGMVRAPIHRRQKNGMNVHVQIHITDHFMGYRDRPVPREQRRQVDRGIWRGGFVAGQRRRHQPAKL